MECALWQPAFQYNCDTCNEKIKLITLFSMSIIGKDSFKLCVSIYSCHLLKFSRNLCECNCFSQTFYLPVPPWLQFHIFSNNAQNIFAYECYMLIWLSNNKWFNYQITESSSYLLSCYIFTSWCFFLHSDQGGMYIIFHHLHTFEMESQQ